MQIPFGLFAISAQILENETHRSSYACNVDTFVQYWGIQERTGIQQGNSVKLSWFLSSNGIDTFFIRPFTSYPSCVLIVGK